MWLSLEVLVNPGCSVPSQSQAESEKGMLSQGRGRLLPEERWTKNKQNKRSYCCTSLESKCANEIVLQAQWTVTAHKAMKPTKEV
jgi:hypothetical protein